MIVENFLKDYIRGYKNYHLYWNYEDGCVLQGAKQLFEATADEEYLSFVLSYLSEVIAEDGTIINYESDKINIDSINSGKVLFFAYDKTGEEKYRKAIEFLMNRLRNHPRIPAGNFWHKEIYPNQVWLDGLYMALPFYAEYETRFGGKEHYSDIAKQFQNVRNFLFDEDKGLYLHGYDDSREQPWCDKKTGRSQNVWLRSVGWLLMAYADTLDALSDEIFEHFKAVYDLYREAVRGILPYRDTKSGLFYQVVDKGEIAGNYTEASGSAMVAYSILKGCNKGFLPREKYLGAGKSIFDWLVNQKLKRIDGKPHLTDICLVAGLGPGNNRNGSIEYYLSEKTGSDDSKGVGPFMMAYAQYLKADNR